MADEKKTPDKAQQPDQRSGQGAASARQASAEVKPALAAVMAEAKNEDSTLAAGLDQIREILFGGSQRELERRLARADVHFGAKTQELEQEIKRRTTVLENHLVQETEALAARFEREFAEVGETLRKMGREMRDAVGGLELKIAKVAESSAQGQRDLRHQLLEQAKSYLDELQRLRAELLATLQQELGLAEGDLAEEPRAAEQAPRH